MTYSSGKRAHLTADPYPWAFSRHCSITNSEPWHNNRFATRNDGALLWFPRPEFNRPLTNPANPILEYFRTFLVGRTGSDFRYQCISLIDALDDAEGYSADELAHARAVLERLVRLGERDCQHDDTEDAGREPDGSLITHCRTCGEHWNEQEH